MFILTANSQYIVRAESSSTLSAGSPSLKSTEIVKYKNNNNNVDSSNVIKPSEYKRISTKTNIESTNDNNKVPIEVITLNKSKATVRLDEIDEIVIDNKQQNYIPHTNNNNNNKTKEKPKNKCWKCCKWYQSFFNKYNKCAENSVCCKKFKHLQKLGRKYITTRQWFKVIILLAMLGNCVFIALEETTN